MLRSRQRSRAVSSSPASFVCFCSRPQRGRAIRGVPTACIQKSAVNFVATPTDCTPDTVPTGGGGARGSDRAKSLSPHRAARCPIARCISAGAPTAPCQVERLRLHMVTGRHILLPAEVAAVNRLHARPATMPWLAISAADVMSSILPWVSRQLCCRAPMTMMRRFNCHSLSRHSSNPELGCTSRSAQGQHPQRCFCVERWLAGGDCPR